MPPSVAIFTMANPSESPRCLVRGPFIPCTQRASSLAPCEMNNLRTFSTYRCICNAEHLGATCALGETIFTETFASYPVDPLFSSTGLFYTANTNCAVLSNLVTNSYAIDHVTSYIGDVGSYEMAPRNSFFIMDTTTSKGRHKVEMSWTVGGLNGHYELIGLRVTAAADESNDNLPFDPASNFCQVRE